MNEIKISIEEKKTIICSLAKQTNIFTELFESCGLKISSFGFNIIDEYFNVIHCKLGLKVFIEITSTIKIKNKKDYYIIVNIYDKNGFIIGKQKSQFKHKNFNGLGVCIVEFRQKEHDNIALNAHNATIEIEVIENLTLIDRINNKKIIIDNLINNTEILEKQFKRYGLSISSMGFNFNSKEIERSKLYAFLEINSFDLINSDDIYYIIITLFNENNRILASERCTLITSEFNGYDVGKFIFNQKGIIESIKKVRVAITDSGSHTIHENVYTIPNKILRKAMRNFWQ